MVTVMLASGIARALALLLTPLFIRYLVRHSFGQFIRELLVLFLLTALGLVGFLDDYTAMATMAGAILR